MSYRERVRVCAYVCVCVRLLYVFSFEYVLMYSVIAQSQSSIIQWGIQPVCTWMCIPGCSKQQIRDCSRTWVQTNQHGDKTQTIRDGYAGEDELDPRTIKQDSTGM